MQNNDEAQFQRSVVIQLYDWSISLLPFAQYETLIVDRWDRVLRIQLDEIKRNE